MPRRATSTIVSSRTVSNGSFLDSCVNLSEKQKSFESDSKLEDFTEQKCDNTATVSVGSLLDCNSKPVNYLEESNNTVSGSNSVDSRKNAVNHSTEDAVHHNTHSKKQRINQSFSEEPAKFSENKTGDPSYNNLDSCTTSEVKLENNYQQSPPNHGNFAPQDSQMNHQQPNQNIQAFVPNQKTGGNPAMHVSFQPMHHPAVAAAVAASAFFQSQKSNQPKAQMPQIGGSSFTSGSNTTFPVSNYFPGPSQNPDRTIGQSSISVGNNNLPFFSNQASFPTNIGSSPFHMMAYHKNMQQHNHPIIGAHSTGNVMNSVLSSQSSGNISNIQRQNIGSSLMQSSPQSIIGQNPEACHPNQSDAISNPVMSSKSQGDIPSESYLSATSYSLNENNNNNMSSIISSSNSPIKLSHPYYSNNHNFNQHHTYPNTAFDKNNLPLLQEKQQLGSLSESKFNLSNEKENESKDDKERSSSDADNKKQRAREKNRMHSRNSRLRKKDSIMRMKEDNSLLQKFKIITEAMADMVSVHDLTDEARLIYANPSFVAKYIIPDVVPFPGFKMFPRQPNVRVPACFLQLVHEDDVKTLIDCIRFVRSDATQAPILRLRLLTSSAPPCSDMSRLFSFFQSRIQVSSSVGSLIIVTRPAGSDNEFFRYTPKNELNLGGDVAIGPTGFICKS